MMETLKGLQTPRRKSPCHSPWQKVGGCSGVGLGGKDCEGGLWGGRHLEDKAGQSQQATFQFWRATSEWAGETESWV